MLFKSQILTRASGSIGGLTASHNRFGAYMRARTTPVNPNTILQEAVRTIFANLAAAWQGLTDLQRTAWDDYGANVPVVNRIGDVINLTGFNHYIRSNVPRLQVGLPQVDDGPTNYTLPGIGDLSWTAVSGAGLLIGSIVYDAGEDWVNEDDAALLISFSRQMAPTINFFKGPFNSQPPLLGDLALPPAPPFAAITTIPATSGNVAYAAYRVTRADGRLSSQVIQVADIV